MKKVELAIVGAGPAGIHAALQANEAGLNTVMVDSNPRPGGQYYKQLPLDFGGKPQKVVEQEGSFLVGLLESTSVEIFSNTLVWGVFPASRGEGWLLNLHGEGVPKQIQAHSLILATGAYDTPIPFPGWTLPGVMTAGAGLISVKNQRVMPGKRALLTGTGPLQLALASSLIHAGVEVAMVLEASQPFPKAFQYAPVMINQWSRILEGVDYGFTMLRARVPYRLGWAVIEARGDGQVEEAVIARMDNEWHPLRGTEQVVQVDTIFSGYTVKPNNFLGRMMGCEFRPDHQQGGLVPVRDEWMQTSLPGVYLAGDAAGIGGAELARVEGKVAAVAAAVRAGRFSEKDAKPFSRRMRGQLRRQRRFANLLSELFTPQLGVISLATDNTIICRCEEVTLGDIRKVITEGARTVNDIKVLTRCGMGNCQGRNCELSIARILVQELGASGLTFDEVGVFRVRPPLHPLPVSVLADSLEVEG